MITIKTKEEIAILREGGKRHAFILRELKNMVKPGLSTQVLEDRARELIKEGGDTSSFLNYKPRGLKTPFPAALCVSINNEVVHGIPDPAKVLKDGDLVTLDLGLIHKGLFTDAAITLPVGNVSEDKLKMIRVTEEALANGIKAARGGKSVGDIGVAIERTILPHSYGLVEELCGHGVGYSVHEEPFIPNYGEAGTGPKLKPGMVLAIEPIINLGSKKVKPIGDGHVYVTADGSVSVHVEHTVLITKSGAEILTQ